MRKILSESAMDQKAARAIESFHASFVGEVESAVKSHDWVVVGMAQNPVVRKARRWLDDKKIVYHYIERGSYFSKWHERLAIKLWSGWPTFPQIFHKGKLVGGCDELMSYQP